MREEAMTAVMREVEKADALQVESEDNPYDLAVAIRWAGQQVRAASYLANPELVSEIHLRIERERDGLTTV